MSQDLTHLLAGSSQETSLSDETFSSGPSVARESPEPELFSSPGYTQAEVVRLNLFLEKDQIERRYLAPLPAVNHQWCRLVDMATNKAGENRARLLERKGYVQVSIGGVNKVSFSAFNLCLAC